jgi:phosphatidylcholine synthase
MAGRNGPPLFAWLVHLYTASSAVIAFFATLAIFEYRFRDTFFWLALALAIDSSDGLLARAARVSQRIPWFNGGKLDDIVDYLTYVFVPALFVWRSLLVPATWTAPVAAAILLSSAYGFNRDDAKTSDHFFLGFPSYWNIVVFYLYVMQMSQVTNAVVLVSLAVLVFVPIRYVYPSRTPRLRGFTVACGMAWGAMLLTVLWQLPAVSKPLLWASLAFPAYYVMLSLVVGRQRKVPA